MPTATAPSLVDSRTLLSEVCEHFSSPRGEYGYVLTDTSLGGENIYPLEIEERLAAHPAVARAVVVGLKDAHYGEVVAAFLHNDEAGRERPADDEMREWVKQKLGRHKAPAHIFWLGEAGVPSEVPLTGSGKVKKYEIARLGEEILRKRRLQKL